MPLYTRTGDSGETSLFGGKRVLKCEELVDVYGSIDELNSWVGLIQEKLPLKSIQSDLFTIGSHFAGAKVDLTVLPVRVKEMEKQIDEMEKKTGKLHNFILPGGSQLASFVHIARAVCRRVERQAVALKQGQTLKDKGLTLSEIIVYLNRLSDLFFMFARFINKQENVQEHIWKGQKIRIP